MNSDNTVEKIVLQKCQMVLHQFLDYKQVEQIILNTPEEVYGKLLFRIQREFFGEKKQEEVEVRFQFPATWWQQLKQSYFPKWLLAKYPVVMKDHIGKYRVDAQFYFPDLPIQHNHPGLTAYIPYVQAMDTRFFEKN
ncbi:MAG: hypothetical protein AAFO02_20865 [Bacteroidota bacterium]